MKITGFWKRCAAMTAVSILLQGIGIPVIVTLGILFILGYILDKEGKLLIHIVRE